MLYAQNFIKGTALFIQTILIDINDVYDNIFIFSTMVSTYIYSDFL